MDRYRKTIAAVLGLLALAIAQGLVPDEWLPYANGALAVATALGVYGVRNATTPVLQDGPQDDAA